MAAVVIGDILLKITILAPGNTKIDITELAGAGFFERLSRYRNTVALKEIDFYQDGGDPILYHLTVEQVDGKMSGDRFGKR